MTFLKSEGGTKKILEHLNSIRFKQQRPILGEEVEGHTQHFTERVGANKLFPCFLFSLHTREWKVLLLSTDWLTLMRNMPLCQMLVQQTELCAPFFSLLVFILDSKRQHSLTCKATKQSGRAHAHHNHSNLLKRDALIPYFLHLVLRSGL